MNRFVRTALISLFAGILLCSPAGAEETENMCITCHQMQDGELKKAADDWKESAHAKAGVLCNDCHGGNPTDASVAMEPSQGFRKKPSPKEIPAFCSRCHSNATFMRPHNLRSDQFEKYRQSVHGKRLLEAGDADAPSCVSCHGKHNIKKVDDPLSRVNRKNLVATCAECHSNAAMMAKHNIPANQADLYKESVHGKAYAKGDAGVPTCFNCHGNHGIEKPQTLSFRLVCTQCHVEQSDAYRKSGHWLSAKAGGKPVCIDCHSNHNIQRPTLGKLVEAGELNCKKCHADGTPQFASARAIYDDLSRSRDAIADADHALSVMATWSGSGYQTSNLTAKMDKAKKLHKEMAINAHSLDQDSLREQATKVESITKEVTGEVAGMMKELRTRKVGLAVWWFIVCVFSVVLLKGSKYLQKR